MATCVLPAPSDVLRAPDRSVRVERDASGAPVRLGHGGARGSCVYLIVCRGKQRAFKACALSESELAYCASIQRALEQRDHSRLVVEGHDPARPIGVLGSPTAGAKQANMDGLLALAAPLCVVTADAFESVDDCNAVVPRNLQQHLQDSPKASACLYLGIVMPLYDSSLHRLLVAPTLELACRPCAPAAPLSPSLASRGSIDSLTLLEETSSTSSDDDPNPTAFHSTQRHRRIQSLVVIAAVLRAITRALAYLHSQLPHTFRVVHDSVSSEAFRGFAHQDVRSDNILVSKTGQIVLCDFELVGHFKETDGVLRQPRAPGEKDRGTMVSASDSVETLTPDFHACPSVGRRILPLSYHPPEGPNLAKGDAWLLGLLALELFTGVAPLIRSDVPFDDFGAGPFLAVDDVNGIGWPELRRHIHTKVRPFQSQEMFDSEDSPNAAYDATGDTSPSPRAATVAGYSDPFIARWALERGTDALAEQHGFTALFEAFCEACLQNDPDRRASVIELAEHPLFERLDEITKNRPEVAVCAWVNTIGSSNTASPTRVAG